MHHSPQFLKLVNDAKTRVKETSVAEVKRRMEAGEDFMLLDIREDHEWANGLFRARFTWVAESSSAISSSACRIRAEN